MSEAPKFVQKVLPIWVDALGNLIQFPALPLPYEMTRVQETIGGAVNNGTVLSTGVIDTDWGVDGDDFFLSAIMVLFQNEAGIDWNDEWQQGLHMEVFYTDPLESRILGITLKERPLYNVTAGDYELRKTWFFSPLVQIPAEYRLRTYIQNFSGADLVFDVNYFGVAIPTT